MVSDDWIAKIKTRKAAKTLYLLAHPNASHESTRKFSNKWAYKTKIGPDLLTRIEHSIDGFLRPNDYLFPKSSGKPGFNRRLEGAKSGFETYPMARADATPSRIRVYGNPKEERLALFLHELTHATPYSKNDLVTANAYSRYLAIIEDGKEIYFDEVERNKEIPKLIEDSFKHKIRNLWRVKFKRDEYGKNISLNGKKYAYDNIGQWLASISENIEKNSHIPGSGLILIREVSKGRKIIDVEKEIYEGKYTSEINALLRKTGLNRFYTKHSRLENHVGAFIAIGSLVLSILFISSKITGNIIGANETSSNWISIILFIVCIFGAFLYFRKR